MEVVLAEVKGDIIFPSGVAPQVKGLLARVEDMGEKLVVAIELAPQ